MKIRPVIAVISLSLALVAGSVVAVGAQTDTEAADPVAATFVTGKISTAEQETVVEPVETTVDGVLQGRGLRDEGATIESNDPRLTGSITRVLNANVWQGTEFSYVRSDQVRIENEAGSWSGPSTTIHHSGAGIPEDEETDLHTTLLTGEGDYEGLSAHLVTSDNAFEGIIFAGEPPPFPEPIEPAAASAEDDLLATTFVTGTLGDPAQVTEGVETRVDGVTERRGWVFADQALETDDPRLTGTVSAVVSGDERIVTGTNFRVDLQSGTIRIENDGGGWTGSLTSINHFRSGGDPTTAIDTAVLSGEGAYEGLSAYLLIDFSETPAVVQGTVFAGEMPPFPELPPAE